MTSRRAWTVWSVALAAYIVAVLHRTSLGVAGLDAQERFDIGASALASFAVLQLLVYAALQVPVGLLLDRFGSLRLIVTGGLLMAAGQALMATTHGIGGAVPARILVGAGDAMTFISVLRLVPQWFPARRVPVLTQLTGLVGQTGQVLVGRTAGGAARRTRLDHRLPRRRGRRGVRRDRGARRPARHPAAADRHRRGDQPAPGRRRPGSGLAASRHPAGPVVALHHPVRRHGLRADVGLPVPGRGRGRGPGDRERAADRCSCWSAWSAGPLLGVLVQRHPLRRSWLVLGVVGANATAWAAGARLAGARAAAGCWCCSWSRSGWAGRVR